MKRIAIVGAGQRCYASYAEPLTKEYADKVKILAVCDTNIGRCDFYKRTLSDDIKTYTANEFDKMLDENKPDALLVTTCDGFHHEYIIRALDKGYDVISEKPLTTTADRCLEIREAEKRSGKHVTVTFNVRFMPYFAKMREVMLSGIIGKPLHVTYEYTLKTNHGGDYFKRWHRKMEMSGGMMVHKATHHFDIVNWILGDEPARVSAIGSRLYYGNDDRPHGERCSACDYTESCEVYRSLYKDDLLKGLYFDNEKYDGYLRDHCAFSSDTDIYDTMSVSVEYKQGALLTYSLNLYSTREGFTINIIGEKGRILLANTGGADADKICVYPRNAEAYEIAVPKYEGGHNGADEKMLEMLFGGEKEDTLGQCSGSFDGVKSAIIGIAANESIKTGNRIELTELLDRMR